MRRFACLLFLVAGCLMPAGMALANCLPIVQKRPLFTPARFQPVNETVPKGHVSLSFLGHASWLIETPGGVTAVTDYNGWIKPARLPDIVTMNHAHSSHYTDAPEPGIKHVLRGWRDDGKMAQHFLKIGDMRVRNVPTNIRSYGGTERNGNSIFVFEAGDLCVAHLGHLHHTLTETHLTELGAIDIVLAPVDGGYTLDTEGMMEVLRQIKAPLIFPMHYFSTGTLERFLTIAAAHFTVEHGPSPTVVLSRQDLPKQPTVRVLPGF